MTCFTEAIYGAITPRTILCTKVAAVAPQRATIHCPPRHSSAAHHLFQHSTASTAQ